MPTYEEARSIILENVAPLGTERVETGRALGRTLAEDVSAPWPLPFRDNSAMDGYAVRADDCRGPARLRITGYIPAGGTASAGVEPGCAVKIMTGAPIPPGCDAVIPFEETGEADDHVVVKAKVTVRQHIRFRAEDVREGDVVLQGGTPLRPPEISMLASLGKAFVPVYRKVRVAVLSTGDELIELGEPPSPGTIINSNSLAVAAAVRETGAEAVLLGIARDDLECHAEKISEGLKADALVTTAGVSAGDRDLVREVLAQSGVVSRFWRVGIKPGGPTAFGTKDGVPVFSLPGNPVSALITFEVVRPARAPPDDGANEGVAVAGQGDPRRRGAEKTREGPLPAGRDRGQGWRIHRLFRRGPEHRNPQDDGSRRRHCRSSGRQNHLRRGRTGGRLPARGNAPVNSAACDSLDAREIIILRRSLG